MAIRKFAALVRSLRVHRPTDASVHFHQGATGAPAPCFEPRCANPQLPVE